MRACVVAIVILSIPAPTFAQWPSKVPQAVPLWLKGAPGSESRVSEAEEVAGANVCNVHNPTLTPYVPEADKATGTGVIICPGGGHSKLCLGHEGYALAEWFRERGIAAFVLKYRLAREKGSPYTVQDHAMADTRRAIRLVRSQAGPWHVHTDRIGILGFSAGGELAAYAGMKHDDGAKDATDPIERASSRPNFQALMYPGGTGSFKVEPGMPPVFLAAGYKDRPDIAEGLATLYLAYKAAKVPAELHIFANAGHGFGYRADAKPSGAARWPERFTEWLADSGLLK
jgi:acetyl esterase/lipase